MSGGGSDTQQQTQSQTQQQTILPDWVNNAAQSNYNLASQIAGTPYNDAMQRYVQGWTPQQQQGANVLQANTNGQTGNLYGSAESALTGLLGYTPSNVSSRDVSAGQVAGSDLSPYLNPYTQDVINTTMRSMGDANTQALAANSANASAAHAFGGTRQGVVDALTNSEFAKNTGAMAANLNQANYNNATGLLTGDINRRLTADTTNAGNSLQASLANQSAGLQGAGLRLNSANSLGNMAGAQSQTNINAGNALFNAGLQGQQTQQGQLDVASQNAGAPQQYATQQLQLLLSSLGMSPYGTTTTGTSNSTTDKQTSSEPDLATAGLGIGKLLGLGGTSGLLSGAGPLAALFSEDTAKTDKQLVGKVPGTSLNAYAFRYKDDPKSYPKTVGLMASDVEKKVPQAITKTNGKRVVNYGMALSGARRAA